MLSSTWYWAKWLLDVRLRLYTCSISSWSCSHLQTLEIQWELPKEESGCKPQKRLIWYRICRCVTKCDNLVTTIPPQALANWMTSRMTISTENQNFLTNQSLSRTHQRILNRNSRMKEARTPPPPPRELSLPVSLVVHWTSLVCTGYITGVYIQASRTHISVEHDQWPRRATRPSIDRSESRWWWPSCCRSHYYDGCTHPDDSRAQVVQSQVLGSSHKTFRRFRGGRCLRRLWDGWSRWLSVTINTPKYLLYGAVREKRSGDYAKQWRTITG